MSILARLCHVLGLPFNPGSWWRPIDGAWELKTGGRIVHFPTRPGPMNPNVATHFVPGLSDTKTWYDALVLVTGVLEDRYDEDKQTDEVITVIFEVPT